MRYQSVFQPGLFAGQIIVVTGGGSGIGRCIAHELAALGAHVVRVDRTSTSCTTWPAKLFDGFHLAETPQVFRS